jgi:hypothetical protein
VPCPSGAGRESRSLEYGAVARTVITRALLPGVSTASVRLDGPSRFVVTGLIRVWELGVITDSRFWVFDWLAERGIDDSAGVARVLNDRSLYKELRLAVEQNGAVEVDKLAGTAPLVAGAGIDLTGAGACDSSLCIRKQVDVLFKHAWHYFDQIALTDLTPSIVDTPFGKVAETSLNGWLEALVYTFASATAPRFSRSKPPKDYSGFPTRLEGSLRTAR